MVVLSHSDDFANIAKKFPNVAVNVLKLADIFKSTGKDIIACADVKSGKKIMVQGVSCVIHEYKGREVRHIHLTKLYRKDSNEQIQEQRSFPNLEAFAIKGKSEIKYICDLINKWVVMGFVVIIHLDESDYGAGSNQILSAIHRKYYGNGEVRFFWWSATSQELIHSGMVKRSEVEVVKLDPGENYKGAEWYLSNDLVTQSERFWTVAKNERKEVIETPSVQGLDVLIDFFESDKNFLIIRFNGTGKTIGGYSHIKNSGMFARFIENIGLKFGHDVAVKFIDGENSFNWGNGSDRSWLGYVADKKKAVLVVCQTATRSTLWGFHKHIHSYHDHREDSVALTTMIQSFGRAFHYDEVGHKIKLYCNLDAVKVAAGRMSEVDYVGDSFKKKISTRVDTKSAIKVDKQKEIHIYNSKAEAEIGVNTLLKSNGELPFSSLIVSTCSAWNDNDLAQLAMNAGRYGFSDKGNIHRLYHLNSQNPNFANSWEILESTRPDMVGKYVYVYLKEVRTINSPSDMVSTKVSGRGSSMYR